MRKAHIQAVWVKLKKSKAFTFVELVTVLAIMAVLICATLPTFTDASQAATQTNLLAQLQTVRSQLQLYQAQHSGQLPEASQLWAGLTKPTNIDGSTAPNAPFGPYIQQAPVNPCVGFSTVADATGTAGAGPSVGWLYDATTGAIYASVPSAQAAALGLTTNDVVTY